MPVLSVLCHFFFCLMFSCQTYVLISLRRIIVVTQDLTFTSLLSFLLPLLSQLFCSVSWIFLAAAPPSLLLCSAFTPWFCSLRQESATDWGGCFKSIIARSEAIHLWYLSLSLPLPFLSLCSASESRDDCACLFLQGSKCYTICMLQHLTLTHNMLAR